MMNLHHRTYVQRLNVQEKVQLNICRGIQSVAWVQQIVFRLHVAPWWTCGTLHLFPDKVGLQSQFKIVKQPSHRIIHSKSIVMI